MIAAIILALSATLALLGYNPWSYALAAAPLVFLIDTALLWVLYLAIMRLQEVRDAGKIPSQAMPIAKAILGFGLMVDFLYNSLWATVLFFDPPREWLVTGRMSRYKYDGGFMWGWQLALTLWFCDVLLDPFDPSGQHVKP